MARPALTVEVAFGSTWQTASPTWTDITADVLSVSTSTGRGRDSASLTAGAAKVVCFNPDDSYTPDLPASANWPDVVPLTPIRVLCEWDSTEYPVWSGFVREWQCDWTEPARPVVTLDCVDAFRVFGQLQVESPYYVALMDLGPTYYWRCGKPKFGRVTRLADSTANNLHGALYGAVAGNGQSVLEGDSNGAIDLGTNLESESWAFQSHDDAKLSGTADFTIGLWWDGHGHDMSGGTANMRKFFEQGTNSSMNFVFLGYDTVFMAPAARVTATGSNAELLASPWPSLFGPVFLVLTRSGATSKLWMNGVEEDSVTAAAAASIIAEDQYWFHDTEVDDQMMKGVLDECFVFTGTALSGTAIADLYEAGFGYRMYSPGERVVQVLDAAGWPDDGLYGPPVDAATFRRVDYAPSDIERQQMNPLMEAWRSPQSLLQLLQDCVDVDDGDCFIDRAGAVRYIGRAGRPVNVDETVSAVRPAGYWPLQETSGTTASDERRWPRPESATFAPWSLSTVDGTYVGSPTLGADGLVELSDATSVEFDGSAQYVTVSHAAQLNGTDAGDSYSMLVAAAYVVSDSFATEQPIVSKCDGSDRTWWLTIDTAGKARFGFRTSGGTVREVTSTVTMTAGETYAVMGSYDSYDKSELMVAVNGVVTTSATYTDLIKKSSIPVNIGRRHDGSGWSYFDGRISHVWVATDWPFGMVTADWLYVQEWSNVRQVPTVFDNTGTLPYVDCELAAEEQRIVNIVQTDERPASPLQDDSSELVAVAQVDDTDSRSRYGDRLAVLDFDQFPVWQSLGQKWTRMWRHLARYSQPKLRVVQLELDGELAPDDLWPTILGMELSDRVGVRHTLYSGNQVESVGYAARVEHQIAKGVWRTTVQLGQ